MGRFYRTTSDTPIDYMSRLNTPLMAKVLMANDEGIENSLLQDDKLRGLADFEYLQQDSEAALKVRQEVEAKADELSRGILSDPANWRKQLQPLRQFGQSLKENYTHGPISKYRANYAARKAAFDTIDKQTLLHSTSGGKKGVSQARGQLAKAYADRNFTGTGYDPATKAFNSYKGISLMDDIDMPKRLSDGLEKMKASGELRVSDDISKGGQYFNKTSNKWEAVTPDRILSIVTDRLQGDTELMDYLRQDTEIGHMRGVFDEQGKFVAPYSYTPVKLSPEQTRQIEIYKDKLEKLPDNAKKKQLQAQLDDYTTNLGNERQLNWNDSTPLSPIMQGIIRQFSYSKNENKNELRGNPVWTTTYSAGQAWARQSRQLGQADDHFNKTLENAKNNFKEKMDWEKYKFDNPHTKAGTGTKTKAGEKVPVETGVSQLSTFNFEDILVPDKNNPNKEVPYFSNAGLSSSIDALKSQQEGITRQIEQIRGMGDNTPTDNLQIMGLERQLQDVTANLKQTREFYNMTTNAVLNKNKNAGAPLDDKDIALYKEFENDRDGSKFREHIKELRKNNPDIPGPSIEVGRGVTNVPTSRPAPVVAEAMKKLDNYLAAHKRVNVGKDNFLTNMRRSYIHTDAIVPNEKEATETSDILLSNPQGLEIFDVDGQRTSGTRLDGKGLSWGDPESDNYNMQFSGKNNLADYIQKNNVKMNVQQIGGTTGLGNGGGVVKVTFDDETGGIPKDKPYYIVMPSEMNRAVAGKFSKHKNPAVVKIANYLADDEAGYLMKQFASPDVQTLTGENAPEKVIYVNSPDGTRAPLYVTELDGGHLSIQYEDNEGKMIPFPRVGEKKGKSTGLFNGPSDWIEQWKGQKLLKQMQK